MSMPTSPEYPCPYEDGKICGDPNLSCKGCPVPVVEFIESNIPIIPEVSVQQSEEGARRRRADAKAISNYGDDRLPPWQLD